MDLLTEAEAQQVIENFKTQLRVNSKQYGKRPLAEYTGAAVDVVEILNDAINKYGAQLVGSILEDARSHISIDEPWFYYETNNQEIDDLQEFEISIFENDIQSLIDELIAQLEEEEREREERERREEEEEEEREEYKPTKEELRKEYRRARRQLQQLVRRRAKKGIDVSTFGIKVPKIPKKITAGSIRRLVKEIAKLKAIKTR